jgi:hypothetical protein
MCQEAFVSSLHIAYDLLILEEITQQQDFCFMARQPLVGQGVLSIEASRSHSDTRHSVGLPWTNDRPVAETST